MDVMLPKNFWSFDVMLATDEQLERRRQTLDALDRVIERGDISYPALQQSRFNVACMFTATAGRTPLATEAGAPVTSPCHGASIAMSRGDGVLIGCCSVCYANVCRINPRSGRQEWLDGNSPWSMKDLRPIETRG